MPFTPYHFGLGLLFKAGLPKHFSFTVFAATAVLVDIEVLVKLSNQTWPIHAELHTVAGATSVGVACALAVHLIGRTTVKKWFPNLVQVPVVRAEFGLGPALLGGVVGGVTASLLDALMHSDVQPFWPFSTNNPFLGLIGTASLHYGCLLAGAIGALILYGRLRSAAKTV